MLYISTRSKRDFYTAYRALHEDRAPDGGLYMPMQIPTFENSQILALKTESFFDTVAKILNLFFPVRISAWDVKVCFGRCPVKLIPLGHKITMAEIWHVLESSYENVVQRLYEKMTSPNKVEPNATKWTRVAVRIATLFGMFGEIKQPGFRPVDLVVTADDFSTPMAAWYAKQMGLPIGRIICACNENSAVWDLLYRGELNTANSVIHTLTPELDIAVPEGLEWLIAAVLGQKNVGRFLDRRNERGVFVLEEEALFRLNDGLRACVVSSRRVSTVIRNVFMTSGYIIDPYAAICYGCLQDYRATTGERTDTLVLSDRGPFSYIQIIAAATGLKSERVEELIRNN